MDNRQLLYFFTITEAGSISGAAEKLHIAQPYLSRQLKLLEEELGITLIERTTRKFHITEAGQMLAYRAKQILDLSEATVKELQDLGAGVKGTLSIGCLSSATETILTQKICEFHQQYENVDFEIRQCSSPEMLELLKRGLIEVGIIRGPANSDLFESISMPIEPMMAVVSDCAFDIPGGKFSFEELAEKPLLVHRRFERDILSAFHKKDLHPRVLCKVEDTRPLLLLAEQGIGVAIVPRDWVALISATHLKSFAVEELHMDTGATVVWMKNRYLTLAATHFLESFTQ